MPLWVIALWDAIPKTDQRRILVGRNSYKALDLVFEGV